MLKKVSLSSISKRAQRSHGFFNQRGFTLIEILVTIFLLALLLSMLNLSTGVFSPHTKLLKTLDNIERAIRFAADEAALRNTVVRVRFFLEKEPQEFTVEFGPDEHFVIPKKLVNFQTTSLNEEESRQELQKEVNNKFSKVDEFSEEDQRIDDAVKVIAMGTDLYQTLVADSDISLYVYPTGEKDSGLIFLGTDQEMASIRVDAFSMDFDVNFYSIDGEVDFDDLQEVLFEQAKAIFTKWLRNE